MCSQNEDQETPRSALISREQIEALHNQLASMSTEGTVSPIPISIREQESSNHHDYMNDDVLVSKAAGGADYINQDIIDMVLTDGQGE